MKDDDFHVLVGRATGGRTFVGVVHLPTKRHRHVDSIGDRTADEVARELLEALKRELAQPDEGEPLA